MQPLVSLCVCVFVCVLQSGEGKEEVTGVRMRDTLTGDEWDVRAKVVINATGVYIVHV